MRLHRRFFVEPDQAGQTEISISGPTAHQIAHVVRLKPGDRVTLLDGTGTEYDAEIIRITRGSVEARIVETKPCENEPRVCLIVAVCLPKGDKMGLIVQKCTELGVSRIIPVTSERTVMRPEPERVDAKLARWRKVAVEAAEQSGRAKPPAVNAIVALSDLRQEMNKCSLVLLAWEEEHRCSLKDVLGQYCGSGPVMLIIGPEGGFTEAEVSLIRDAGARCISLGRRRLRTETATLAGAAAVMYALEGEL